MTEYIKREDALKAMEWKWAGKAAFDAVKAIPSADVVERKKGEWYDRGSLSCRCSRCRCKSPEEFSFCPNCGADMRGRNDG